MIDTGLGENLKTGPVSGYAHNIIKRGYIPDQIRIDIHDRHIVIVF